MWEISRDRLLRRLKILDLVPEKVGLSSSEFYKIRGKGEKIVISVASYIMGEVTITGKGKWPTKRSFYIDRRVFTPFVNASLAIKNKNTFQFEIKGDMLIVRHGERKAKLASQQDVRGYGNLKKVLKEKESEVPMSDNLRTLLLCGQNCAVSDSIDPHLNCVYINKGKMAIEAFASSDKIYYMGMGDSKQEKVKASIPFPLLLIKLLTEETLEKISWRGNYIVLKFDKGIIWQPISVEASKNFPLQKIQKYEQRASKMPIIFTTSSRRLSKLMVRLGYYLQAVRRKDWIVSMAGKKGKKIISVSTNIPGANFLETMEIADKLKTDVKLEWPLDVLEPVFSFLSTKTKKLGMVVRSDERHGISYLRVGAFWLCITSKQEKEK
jgi:hypothetical protein